MFSIHANDVGLAFPMYGHRSLRVSLVDLSLARRIRHEDRPTAVVALSHISFDLRAGDRCALIGHNGAGKSTLLHTISGLYEPTCGQLSVTGQVTTLTNLRVGMEDDADGYENILLRAMMMGYSRRQVTSRADEIIDFADLGDFIRRPLRTYSEGMRMRLSFAVGTTFSSEILLVDEILGASDHSFMRKALARLKELTQRSSIVVMASHALETLRPLCNVGIWLEKGQIRQQGTFENTTAAYLAADRSRLPRNT